MSAQPESWTRAVLYLRVSTKEQAERGGESEGFSIPAQREAGLRKAQSLEAHVVSEFIDAGQSARSADRPELQRMLDYLNANRDVRYVIVHKVDRLARSRSDDVAINLAIRQSGASLVSCTENIDETPNGMLLHGIMSSIAEFYSQNLANEVVKGTQQKVRAGGTPTRAPIGYQNTRQLIDGYEVRTVELDAERANLITWAFDAYATGDWSLRSLADELAEQGLTFRPGPKTSARPVPANKLHAILKNRYYLGYVSWRGVEYDGKHPPLTDAETFETVQAVLADHRASGERNYRQDHYLVGSLRCGLCNMRMLYTVSRGRNSQEYGYFYCASRVRKSHCGQRYLPAHLIEQAVETQWSRELLTPSDLTVIHEDLLLQLAEREEQVAGELKALGQQAHRIRRDRFKWAEKSMDGVVPDDVAAAKQHQLAKQLLKVEKDIAQRRSLATVDRETLNSLFGLMENLGLTYPKVAAPVRRSMNQAWFKHLVVTEDEDGVLVTDAEHQPLTAAVRGAIARQHAAQGQAAKCRRKDSGGIEDARVSNVDLLVELRGFEPLTFSLRTRRATNCATAPVRRPSIRVARAKR